jgi:hypothetical protein
METYSIKEAAKCCGVSEQVVQAASILKKANPEKFREVWEGKISLNAALEAANLDPIPDPSTTNVGSSNQKPMLDKKPMQTEIEQATEVGEPIEVTTVMVTPELAKQLLEKNNHNRPVSESRVSYYARQIEDGDWKLNGESIIVAKDGTLLDGQHRLLAIIEAGIPIQALIVRNVDRETFATIDGGSVRSIADIYGIDGEEHPKTLAAAARYLDNLIAGRGAGTDRGRLAPEHARRVIKDHPGLKNSLWFVTLTRPRLRGVSEALLVALHYLFAQKSVIGADLFIDQIIKGVSLKEKNPAYLFRQFVINSQLARKKLPASLASTKLIKAWNEWGAGRSLTKLKTNGAEGVETIKRPKVELPWS